MIKFIEDAITHSVYGLPLLGTMLLGLIAGIIGIFTVLRKESLIGDALSHASLPGVVLMYMFTQSESVSVLLIGAGCSAAISLYLMQTIKKYSKIQSDALLALILSSFFGLGNFLISYVGTSKINLKDYIFGSAATIIRSDVYLLCLVAVVIFMIIGIFWRHLKTQTFDYQYYISLGFSSRLINFLVSTMTIMAIVVGIKTVGVILMSSLLIVPAISARLWDKRLIANVLISTFISLISGFLGVYYSIKLSTPIGPMVVIIGTLIAVISILMAPRRGLIAKEILRILYKKSIKKFKILIDLYQYPDIYKHERFDEKLIKKSYVIKQKDYFVLTDKGIAIVERMVGGGI